MLDSHALQLRKEGACEFLAPAGGARLGAGTSSQGVFFNPAMAFGRDLSVLYVAAVRQPGIKILDGLTGIGVRALRWRLEVGDDYEIVACDRDPQVIEIAKHNIARIGDESIRLLHRPLESVLAEEQFNLIDLDAPGSPMPFLDMACQSLHTRKMEGHLLITATDTMVLAGAQPRACHRRYGAWPMQGEMGHEVAVRILLGAVVRANARYGRMTVPVLSFAHGHWYGVYVRVAKDERQADAALEQLGYAFLCPSCWERRVIRGEVPPTRCTHCGEAIRLAGPLWTGALWDAPILEQMLADGRALAQAKDVRAALKGWLQESSGPPLFYDIHAAVQHLGCAIPNFEELQHQLALRGFRSVRTHFAKTGLKTDADARLVLELIRNCKPTGMSSQDTHRLG